MDLIKNEGTTLAQAFEYHFKNCTEFEIATAFITEEAIPFIETFINENKNKYRSGKLITGLYKCFNSKAILLKLDEIAKKSLGKFSFRISSNLDFHWKYYHFEHKSTNYFYIGSANFTKKGINDSGELTSKTILPRKKNNATDILRNPFAKEWATAKQIKDLSFNLYLESKTEGENSIGLNKTLIEELGNKQTVLNKNKSNLFKVIRFTANLSKRTINKVSTQKSNWDKNGYDFFVLSTKAENEKMLSAEKILILESSKGSYYLSIAEIKDNEIINTADGKYFIAYKCLRGKENKKANQTKLDELGNLGVKYDAKKFPIKNITKNKFEQIEKLVRQLNKK